MQSFRYRRFGAEWILLIALQAAVAGLVTLALIREHRGIRATEVDRLQGQAKVIDDNLIQQIDGADKALRGIASGIQRGVLTTEQTASTQLKLLTDAMPGFRSMLWLDAAGSVVASSRGDLIGRNFAKRDYFEVPRRIGDPDRLYVSPPFHSTVGTYVIVASRMLVDAQGRFAGAVTATLDPEYFSILLRSVLYAPDMRTALVHQSGSVFLDLPEAGAVPRLAAGEVAALLAELRSPPQGPGPAPIDRSAVRIGGATRLVGLRSLDGRKVDVPGAGASGAGQRPAEPPTAQQHTADHETPLVAVVSRELAVVMAPWRSRAWQGAGLWLALVIVSSGGLWLDQRRRREARLASTAAAQERQAAADRVEQALRGADLGLWELHVPTDNFVINARERSLLGYGPEDELPQGPFWRTLIHPDDRERVAAAILPHLHGKAPAYDCEHRMRHRNGEYVWLFSRAMIVERTPDGAPLRIVGTHLDITEPKRTQEHLAQAAAQLRDNEQQLRLLTDNMPALVSRLDMEQRFRFANRAYADWLNIDPASLIGRSLREVYGGAAHDGFRHHFDTVLATGRKVCYERHLAGVGGERRVEFNLVPEFDAQGAVNGFYALATDITARHQAESRQARSEERLSIALEGSGQVLFDWNLAQQTIYQSAHAPVLRGEPPAAGERPLEELRRTVHADDVSVLEKSAWAAVTAKAPLFEAEFRLRHAGGDWIWVRMRGRVVERNPQGRALRITGTYSDINRHKLEEARLRRLAEFDVLTGLPNRALFRDRLHQAMRRASRGKPMALLFLDVDHFKQINDTLGHEMGDEVLKVFAHRMQSVVRASDTVARLGGDEFTIILEELREPADASTIADKLNRALEQPIALGDGRLRVTASIGIAIGTPGEGDDAALLRRADAALYEAKRRGRNSHFCAELGG